jgi:hypothetical protein
MEHFDRLNVTFKSYLTDEKFYEQALYEKVPQRKD